MKPVVHYTDILYPIQVGLGALIDGVLDHPDQERVPAECAYEWDYAVTTSKVLWHDASTGDFETMNTRYVKVARIVEEEQEETPSEPSPEVEAAEEA
jgi:hypothetical protein